MQCGAALGVNPFHMRVGRARDAEHAVPIAVPVLPACPSCAVCKWTPFEFYATALIRGYHETACANPLRLDAAGRVVLREWRHEAIENQVGRVRAAGSFDDERHARLYLMRSQKKLGDPYLLISARSMTRHAQSCGFRFLKAFLFSLSELQHAAKASVESERLTV
jgi:hypothetical protein